MSDRLPFINRLTFRGEERVHPPHDSLPTSIEVNVESSWDRKKEVPMKATIAREVGTMLIEEGLRVLKALHDQTLPVGPFPIISEESRHDDD